MAVVKLSRSGKSVLFIDDDGNVFVTSLSYLNGLLGGSVSYPFLLLKRLPNRVVGHFSRSPLVGESFVRQKAGVDGFDKAVLKGVAEDSRGVVDFEF